MSDKYKILRTPAAPAPAPSLIGMAGSEPCLAGQININIPLRSILPNVTNEALRAIQKLIEEEIEKRGEKV